MTFSCEFDLKNHIDWQRSDATQLIKLIELKELWYKENVCGFWDSWFIDVFCLDTANEFGLSVWSRILDQPIFGEGVGSLTLEQKRIMLQLKAFILHMDGSTYQINKKLASIFNGDLVVFDNLNMIYTYYIYNPEIVELTRLLLQLNLLPRPNSVSIIAVDASIKPPFGFQGASGAAGFGVGTYVSIIQ